MHTLKSDDGSINIQHNGDWSGDAIVTWRTTTGSGLFAGGGELFEQAQVHTWRVPGAALIHGNIETAMAIGDAGVVPVRIVAKAVATAMRRAVLGAIERAIEELL